MSVNNIFVEYNDRVLKRYRKVTVGAVSGVRLNPSDDKERVSFVLQSRLENFNIETGTLTFDYDNDVLELYSEKEVRSFKALNPLLFKNGSIEEYNQEKPEVQDNTLTEKEIVKIANLKDVKKFQAEIDSITSAATLNRIKDTVDALDRPKSFLALVEQRYATLSNT